MNHQDIKKTLDKIIGDTDIIVDRKTMTIINSLVNLIETLAEENLDFRSTIQQLKDQINILKGEQPKPNIRKQKKDGDEDQENSDHSSEKDRNKRSGKKDKKEKNKKKKTVRVDRQVTVDFDKTILPNDAVFKGYECRLVQDIKVITDNVEFRLPTYYSPSLKKTFIAPMPIEYQGSEFGPSLKALVITLYRDSGMTIPAIGRFLKTFEVHISLSTLSGMLIKNHDVFHQEKEEIFNAGIQASAYQHVDDTGSRVNGENHYTHIFCNPFFTAYFTEKKKDRLTLLRILCRGELKYALNQCAYDLMLEFGLPAKWQNLITPLFQEKPLTYAEMDVVLKKLFPNPKKHSTSRRIILESAGLVYYRQSNYFIQYLMSDDAPQFNRLSLYHALCWIHEGRHYKKINPVSALNQKVLDAFLDNFWDYYQALLTYKQNPSDTISRQLSEQFDSLFSTTTGYDALDIRIAMTRTKKEELLWVLTHPFLPLHNNPAELAARVQARIRDINLQTITDNGTKSKDTFATIVQTARKLGVNVYQYIYDRVSKKFEKPSLAEMIATKSKLALNST
jgi:hypothetical protein